MFHLESSISHSILSPEMILEKTAGKFQIGGCVKILEKKAGKFQIGGCVKIFEKMAGNFKYLFLSSQCLLCF
jgi:hypothetical protein